MDEARKVLDPGDLDLFQAVPQLVYSAATSTFTLCDCCDCAVDCVCACAVTVL